MDGNLFMSDSITYAGKHDFEQDEIWKDITGYEGKYQVSNFGRVKSLNKQIKGKNESLRFIKEKIIKQSEDNHGYFVVCLCLNSLKNTRKVHQVVAEAFLNHSRCGHKLVVDHIDNDKSNNYLTNLQIITQRENTHKIKRNYTSKYKGVCWDKKAKKWKAQFCINGKKMQLGGFSTEIEAFNRYNEELNKTK
jgi:hypothetical protein